MVAVVGAVCAGASLGIFIWLVASSRPPAHAEVVGNLSSGIGPRSVALVSARRGAALVTAAQRLVHPGGLTRLERLLTLAGRPTGWSPGVIVLTKIALVAAMIPVAFVVSSGGDTGRVIIAGIAIIVAFFVPELLLYSKGTERQQRIERELADTLDQMTISVEAGLGFDGAMARVANAGHGPLSEEFVRTLQEIQVGVPRREAFRGLAARTTVTDLRRFVGALLQADAYGVPLADTLRVQAEEIRRKRRFRAEHKAMQVPVKVVFPLVMCILPTLFIVLLGPAIIDLVATFSAP
ncbi:MAG: type II secretion system F family protein [Nitriliruptoraceae bacterium]